MTKYLFLFYLIVIDACLAAGPAPLYFNKFDTTYTLEREGSPVGKITRSIQHENGNYTFRSSTETTGFISFFYTNDVVEESKWKIINNQIKPIEYDYFRDKNGKIRKVNIQFDWDNQKIKTHANESKWAMPLNDEVYDKLLYEVVVMQRLNQNLPIKELKIADGGELKTYSFNIVAEEMLDTPLGKLKTLKLERHKSNSNRPVLIWYAIDKDYLPVKVQNVDKEGKIYTAMIKEYKINQ